MSKKDDKNQEPATTIYEMACEVSGGLSTLDTNGRLAKSKHKEASGLPANCSNGETSVDPLQVTQGLPIYSQVGKKRAVRSAQQGGYETIADDFSEKGGEVGKEGDGVAKEDRIVCDSIMDITLVDNPLYAETTVPASSPSSTAAATVGPVAGAGDLYEEINISNTDITLIDNAIYNK